MDLDARLKEIDTKVNDILVRIAVLEVKAGVWGAIAGISVVMIAVIVKWITK
jgi:hypothetical protein